MRYCVPGAVVTIWDKVVELAFRAEKKASNDPLLGNVPSGIGNGSTPSTPYSVPNEPGTSFPARVQEVKSPLSKPQLATRLNVELQRSAFACGTNAATMNRARTTLMLSFITTLLSGRL